MSEPQLQNLIMPAEQTIVTKDGIHVIPTEQAGSHNTSQKDTELLNSSAMDTVYDFSVH